MAAQGEPKGATADSLLLPPKGLDADVDPLREASSALDSDLMARGVVMPPSGLDLPKGERKISVAANGPIDPASTHLSSIAASTDNPGSVDPLGPLDSASQVSSTGRCSTSSSARREALRQRAEEFKS